MKGARVISLCSLIRVAIMTMMRQSVRENISSTLLRRSDGAVFGQREGGSVRTIAANAERVEAAVDGHRIADRVASTLIELARRDLSVAQRVSCGMAMFSERLPEPFAVSAMLEGLKVYAAVSLAACNEAVNFVISQLNSRRNDYTPRQLADIIKNGSLDGMIWRRVDVPVYVPRNKEKRPYNLGRL